MEKIITTLWITTIIITIIPNVLTAYKFITKKYDELGDLGLLEFMSLWTFFCFSVIRLGTYIYTQV